MRFAAVLTALLLIVGFAVAEDKVTLKDGKVITGEVLAVTTSDIQIRTDGEKVRVPRAAVDNVERDGVSKPRWPGNAGVAPLRVTQ